MKKIEKYRPKSLMNFDAKIDNIRKPDSAIHNTIHTQ